MQASKPVPAVASKSALHASHVLILQQHLSLLFIQVEFDLAAVSKSALLTSQV